LKPARSSGDFSVVAHQKTSPLAHAKALTSFVLMAIKCQIWWTIILHFTTATKKRGNHKEAVAEYEILIFWLLFWIVT
jgi:hypothetical protein